MSNINEPFSNLDADLASMSHQQLLEEIIKLRTEIRKHRDSSGHDLCWHHPQLWNLLPEKTFPVIAVPTWEDFISNCAAYRKSLDTVDTKIENELQ